jgi:hypothetical protein
VKRKDTIRAAKKEQYLAETEAFHLESKLKHLERDLEDYENAKQEVCALITKEYPFVSEDGNEILAIFKKYGLIP